MKRKPQRSRAAIRIAGIAILVCALFAVVSPAASQTNIDLIEIVDIDTSAFPDVTIQARVVGPDRLPVPVLSADSITLAENGIAQPFTHTTVDAGAQVALVIDLGAGSDSYGVTGEARYLELAALAERYIEGMGTNDSAMLVVQDETGLSVAQTMTSSKDQLRAALAALEPNYGTATNGLAAVQMAIEELQAITGASKTQAVVFLTTGVQNAIEPGYASVETFAKEFGIPIYAVLSHATESTFGPRLEELAANTNGRYAFYAGDADPMVEEVFAGLELMRVQFKFTFHSTEGTNAERSIVLQARGGGSSAPQDYLSYAVSLADPVVVIDDPVSGAEIVREAETWNQNPDSIRPSSANVIAHLEWPDGYPRRIESAQFFVDGEEYGPPLMDTAPGDNLLFGWDLRPYRTQGDNLARLEIQVVDELGFIARSDETQVAVVVDIPAPPPEEVIEEPVCSMDDGLLAYLRCFIFEGAGMIALVIALAALIIVMIIWRNRRQIAQTAERATEAVGRVTRPAGHPRTAAAYLTVIRGGGPELEGQKFAVPRGTITPIGRDRSQVVIALPDEENSVISRKHCEIREADGVFRLRDFASKYGTYLNNVRLAELGSEVLHHGDEVTLGPIERGGILFKFEIVMEEVGEEEVEGEEE
jgi:pSer/pThr/pTyr-binding forkhead associated (FHA) protein